MRYAYSPATVRSVEERASHDLMSVAAFAIAARTSDLLCDLHGRVYGARVALLVGPGSNGADALYAGVHLLRRGVSVHAWVAQARCNQDAMAAFLHAGGTVVDSLDKCDLIIDGIVGMGSKGSLSQIPELPDAFTVAIDLPSGVVPDTGEAEGLYISADLTLATGAYKVAHFIDPAHDACGVVELIDLGLDFTGEQIRCEVWQREDVAELLQQIETPHVRADKYSKGVLGICAGSQQYPGAGALCAESAIGSGVGMVRSFSGYLPDLPEVVAADGQIQALAVGPGLVEFDDARALLSRDVPAVVDAGAIAHVAAGRAQTLITPHAGELSRLLSVERTWIEAHRYEAVQLAAKQTGLVVLLKGSTTLVAAPDGRCAVNPTGSAALATAGSGDVLTGIIGALMAQGASPFDAAVVGAWLHGLAGSYAESGASAIAQMVPAAFAAIRQY